MERERVDKIKTEIEENPWLKETYEQEKIDLPPSELRKFGRAALDALNIRLGFSEKRRNREAMSVAIGEIDAEQESRRLEELKQEEDKKAELAKQEADRIKAEEEALQEDMEKLVSGTKNYREDFFRAQRLQEIVERDLNSRLLSVETLEEEVLSENPGVSKRSIPYEDTEIPVYDLKGLPFSMLSTTIDFKHVPGSLGYQTSRAVMANPAIWNQRLDEAMKTEGFGTNGVEARGNTICSSFYDSERNITSHEYGELIYGFDHVDAGSVIKTTPGDGSTSNTVPNDDYYLSRYYTRYLNLDPLIKKTHANVGYNEVTTKRYSETGIPKRPDYIVTVNGKISETSLRHAKFHKIPIINIMEQPYFEKMDQRSEEIADSMTESDNYDELTKKIADFRSTSRGQAYWPENGDTYRVGGEYGAATTSWQDIAKESSLSEKVANKKELEHKKRLEYIKSFMQGTIASIDEMMNGNAQYTDQEEAFSTLLSPPNGFAILFRNEEEGHIYALQSGCCNVTECLQGDKGFIKITFKDKNGVNRETEIYKDDGGGNNLYDEFAPIASNYIKACNKLANLPSRKS